MPLLSTRLLIADSQKLFSRALAMARDQAGGFQILEERPTSGLDTIKLLGDPLIHCDLVVLDYWLSRINGPATTRLILKNSPGCRVVLTGWFHTEVEVGKGFQAGAAAFVSKSVKFAQFLEVIRRVADGDAYLYLGSADESPRLIDPPERDREEVWDRLMSLTVREIEVVSLLSFAPVEKVAKTLSISLGTLRNHISNILLKTGARSQIEAIDIARRVGLIDS